MNEQNSPDLSTHNSAPKTPEKYINDLRLLSWLIKEFSGCWFTIKEAYEKIKDHQEISFGQMEEHCSILHNEFYIVSGMKDGQIKYKLRAKFLSREEIFQE